MDPYHDICIECRHAALVWDRDGDIVCTYCGLVKQERYISDEPLMIKNGDDDTKEIYHAEAIHNDGIAERLLNTYWKDLEYENMKELCITLFNKLAEGKKNPLHMSLCAYYASKYLMLTYSIDYICSKFTVCENKFWKEYGNITQYWRDLPFYKDMLTKHTSFNKMVYMLEDIIDHKAVSVWDIMKITRQIEDKIQSRMDSHKKSKVNACIIYIACKIANTCGIKEISKLYNVSIPTLLKHEKLIQGILRSK